MSAEFTLNVTRILHEVSVVRKEQQAALIKAKWRRLLIYTAGYCCGYFLTTAALTLALPYIVQGLKLLGII